MDYFSLPKEELGKNAKITLVKLGSAGEVFYELALDMVNTIALNNEQNKKTVFICPVGPVGQYPIFIRLVNEQQLSLKKVWFFNMDEYLDDQKQYINIDHRLSFRGFMNRAVYGLIDPDLVMSKNQRIFPDPSNPGAIAQLIEELGGVDVCYGGIGITGHLAFNEPEAIPGEEFKTRPTRVLPLTPETRTINSVGDLNGAIDAMPKWAVTIGMREILASRKIRLYCFRDWHRAVVRQAAYGEQSALFPATLLQDHADARITLTENVAEKAY
ncbi:glucosamine-6-phosphate isomerase [Treponema sp.]